MASVLELRVVAAPGGADEASGAREGRAQRRLREHGDPASRPSLGRGPARL